MLLRMLLCLNLWILCISLIQYCLLIQNAILVDDFNLPRFASSDSVGCTKCIALQEFCNVTELKQYNSVFKNFGKLLDMTQKQLCTILLLNCCLRTSSSCTADKSRTGCAMCDIRCFAMAKYSYRQYDFKHANLVNLYHELSFLTNLTNNSPCVNATVTTDKALHEIKKLPQKEMGENEEYQSPI